MLLDSMTERSRSFGVYLPGKLERKPQGRSWDPPPFDRNDASWTTSPAAASRSVASMMGDTASFETPTITPNGMVIGPPVRRSCHNARRVDFFGYIVACELQRYHAQVAMPFAAVVIQRFFRRAIIGSAIHASLEACRIPCETIQLIRPFIGMHPLPERALRLSILVRVSRRLEREKLCQKFDSLRPPAIPAAESGLTRAQS